MELQDHFLIAMPHVEGYFHRAVVYICEHSETQGAMGLVLNQPTDLSVAELVAKMNFMMAMDKGRRYADFPILAGGPVNQENGFILHSKTDLSFKNSYAVSDELQLTTSADLLETLGTAQEPRKYLVALGCASWEPMQLEVEIGRDIWLVVPANENVMFDVPFEQRWLAANQLLGIQHGSVPYHAGNC